MVFSLTRREFLQGATALAAMGLLKSCTGIFPDGPTPNKNPVPQPLLEALESNDLVIQADAARHLGDLGSRQAVPALVRYVLRDRHYAKTAGLDALARIGERSAAADIRPLVADPNVTLDDWWYGHYSVQVAAALTLLALRDDSGAGYLLEDLPEGNGRDWAFFTWFAPTALRLPDTSAAGKVKARITAEKVLPPQKKDPGQIVIICDALGLLATPEAHEALTKLVSSPSRYVRGRASINLVAHFGARVDVARVMWVAEQDPALFARVKAAQALSTKGNRKRDYIVEDAVKSASDPFDRAAAIDSLGAMGYPENVPLIAAQLAAQDPYVRLCAAEALDRIGTPEAFAAAAGSRDDRDLRVRLQVAKTLAREGGARHGE